MYYVERRRGRTGGAAAWSLEAAAQRAATRPLFNSAVTGAQCGLLPQTIAFTKTCTGGEESSTLQTQRSNEIWPFFHRVSYCSQCAIFFSIYLIHAATVWNILSKKGEKHTVFGFCYCFKWWYKKRRGGGVGSCVKAAGPAVFAVCCAWNSEWKYWSGHHQSSL